MKIQKIGVSLNWILNILILVALFIFIQRFLEIRKDSLTGKAQEKNIYVESIRYATTFWGKRFPIIDLKNVINDKLVKSKFDKPTILIIFSSNDCKKCVKDELVLLRKIYDSKLDKKKYDIVAIALGCSKQYILIMRKITKAKFLFCYDANRLLEDKMDIYELPLVLFIGKDNMILSSYYPIPGVGIHSELFLNGFTNLLQGLINAKM